MSTQVDVSFRSGEQRCAARLYVPADAAGLVPCVVMAHGLTGTMDLGLSRYAQRFAAAGFAALVFDYRHFGNSAGQPRQLVDVRRQVTDVRAAVRFARSRPDVDADRIALWGTSLGAGHVITVAASDPRIAAVVAQLPFLGVDVRRPSPRSRRVTRALFTAAIRDAIGAVFGRPPITVPVVGEPGSVAVFAGRDDFSTLGTLAADAPSWRNNMVARSLLSLIGYRPGKLAGHLAMPLMVCVADADTAASVPMAIRAAERASPRRVRRYPGDHFAAYLGEVFERMSADEVTFLRQHLAVVPAASTGAG